MLTMAQSFRVFLFELKEGEGFDQVLGCDHDLREKQYFSTEQPLRLQPGHETRAVHKHHHGQQEHQILAYASCRMAVQRLLEIQNSITSGYRDAPPCEMNTGAEERTSARPKALQNVREVLCVC